MDPKRLRELDALLEAESGDLDEVVRLPSWDQVAGGPVEGVGADEAGDELDLLLTEEDVRN